MLRAAQASSGLATLALFGFAMLYLFNPMAASGANGLDPVGEYGLTNMRTLAAPLLAMAVMAGIGTVKKSFVFVAPAALYFLFTAVIRVFGLVVDGANSQTLRGLVLALVLFALAEFAIFVFKKDAKETNGPATQLKAA